MAAADWRRAAAPYRAIAPCSCCLCNIRMTGLVILCLFALYLPWQSASLGALWQRAFRWLPAAPDTAGALFVG